MANIPTSPKFANKTMIFSVIEDVFNPIKIIPPLYLNINPQNFNKTHNKIINRYQTFSAYVEEYWGEELDTISCDLTTGGFYHESIGLTTIFRTDTSSHYIFKDFLEIYRNNGNIYDHDGRVIKKGSILLNFDEGTYLGYFENFNYTEDSSSPFKFIFDFIFKVEKDYTSL